MNCIYCNGELDRLVPTTGLGKAIRTVMPAVRAMICKDCNRTVLITRNEPYGIRGTVKYIEMGNNDLQMEVFFAMDGELIIGKEIEV